MIESFKSKNDVKFIEMFHFLSQRTQNVTPLQRSPCECVVGRRYGVWKLQRTLNMRRVFGEKAQSP